LGGSETIVAVASPLGRGHRAICRLSGSDAFPLARRLFEAAGPDPAIEATYIAVSGNVRLSLRVSRHRPDAGRPTPEARVPAWLYLMRAPRSYTREDVAELHVPGSPAVVAALVRALVDAGARPARPGEFTQRAFLSGRIDLAQAEAVLGLIRAAGDEDLKSALAGLRGAAGRRANALADDLAQLAALVELGIDFSEEDLEPVPRAVLGERLAAALSAVEGLAAAPSTTPAVEAAVALVGPPNSGKSSLLNALVGHARSIVSPVPGTTRDVITAPLELPPWRLTLADTAGGPTPEQGPSPGDSLAAVAWAAARGQAGLSRLLLVVLDRSEPLSPAARGAVQSIMGEDERHAAREPSTSGAPRLVVLNKSDLPARTTPAEAAAWLPGVPVVEVSARIGVGLDRLRAAIAGAFAEGRVRVGAEGLLVPSRQARAAALARDALRRAQELLDAADRPELFALELRAAREHIASITARAACTDDLLDRIFSQFCIGK
jgi:tRNA modification GTPase